MDSDRRYYGVEDESVKEGVDLHRPLEVLSAVVDTHLFEVVKT
jgi:hypothetical protein